MTVAGIPLIQHHTKEAARFRERLPVTVQPALGSAQDEWRGVPHFAHTLGRIKRGVSVTISDIQRLVADRFGVAKHDIVGTSTARAYSLPRQVAMWLARNTARNPSFPLIAREFGRDHRTVMHGVAVIDARMAADPAFGQMVADLQAETSRRLVA